MTDFTLTVLMYHYVRTPGDLAATDSGIPGLDPAHFAAQLDHAQRQHTVVGWPEVRAALLDEKALPPSACLLTFDDGVRDHYHNIFPALQLRGLSGLFFALARAPGDGLALGHRLHFLLARLEPAALRDSIWSRLSPAGREAFRQAEGRYRMKYGEVDTLKAVFQRELSAEAGPILSRLLAEHVGPEAEVASAFYLTPDQIAEMRAGGMHFGGHSRSHPWFDYIDGESLTAEISSSAEWLRRVEPGPWAFAYPYGGLDDRAPALLKAHGFAAAFTTRSHTVHVDPFLIGRLDGEELSPSLAPAASAAGY